jgi:hypothetical protein
MNIEEATRAKDEGKKQMEKGNFLKAVKMFEISIRLHQNPDTSQLLSTSKAAIALQNRQSSQSTSTPRASVPAAASSSNTSAPTHTLHQSPNMSTLESICLLRDTIIAKWISIENHHLHMISAEMRPYIRGILAIIWALVLWKFVIGGKLSLGRLPGDISYQSSTISIHAPIVSCLIVSFILNAIFKAWSR